MRTLGVPGAIQAQFFRWLRVTWMGLCHLRPAEELALEIPIRRVAAYNFASDKCHEDAQTKQKGTWERLF